MFPPCKLPVMEISRQLSLLRRMVASSLKRTSVSGAAKIYQSVGLSFTRRVTMDSPWASGRGIRSHRIDKAPPLFN